MLPDHLHCIWTLAPGDDLFSERWRLIKTKFSRAIAATESRSKSRLRSGERGIWQRRFWEHLLRDDKDFAQHADYIHYNPVKHGLVNRPIDWSYSSLHRYVRKRIVQSNWGTDGEKVFDDDLG